MHKNNNLRDELFSSNSSKSNKSINIPVIPELCDKHDTVAKITTNTPQNYSITDTTPTNHSEKNIKYYLFKDLNKPEVLLKVPTIFVGLLKLEIKEMVINKNLYVLQSNQGKNYYNLTSTFKLEEAFKKEYDKYPTNESDQRSAEELKDIKNQFEKNAKEFEMPKDNVKVDQAIKNKIITQYEEYGKFSLKLILDNLVWKDGFLNVDENSLLSRSELSESEIQYLKDSNYKILGLSEYTD